MHEFHKIFVCNP